MKKIVIIGSSLSVIFCMGLSAQEEIRPAAKRILTVHNTSSKGCYFWFAGYTLDANGNATKKWHPNYNAERRTVTPLILYPGQGAEIAIPNEECFHRFYSWWGQGYKRVEQKVEKDDRCRNITLKFTGKRKLSLEYTGEQTEEELKKAEEEGSSENSTSVEIETVEEVKKEEPVKKKKGYWV